MSTALEGVAQGFWTVGRPIGRDENGETAHEDVLSFEGGRRFQEAANKHVKALERELGNKNPSDLFPKS